MLVLFVVKFTGKELQNKNAVLVQNVIILFSIIFRTKLARTAKPLIFLKFHKMDVITLYSTLGIPYLDQTKDRLEGDIAVIRNLRHSSV